MSDRGEQHTRTDDTADRIIKLIVDEDLSPGDKLPTEYELAQQLGVGRSTLREAIRRLASRNILETRRGSGIFVSPKRGVPEDPLGLTFLSGEGIDPQRLAVELSDVRIMIEPEIAFLAALHVTKAQKNKLISYCSSVENLILQGQDYSGEDIKFHSYIAECSGNLVLKNLVPVITSSINISIVTTSEKYRTLAIDEHRAIVDAIVNEDAMEARLAMISHLHSSRRAYANAHCSEQEL